MFNLRKLFRRLAFLARHPKCIGATAAAIDEAVAEIEANLASCQEAGHRITRAGFEVSKFSPASLYVTRVR